MAFSFEFPRAHAIVIYIIIFLFPPFNKVFSAATFCRLFYENLAYGKNDVCQFLAYLY